MSGRRAKRERYLRELREGLAEAERRGKFKRESMTTLEESGIPSDFGMVAVDFVLMGRSAPDARRGLAEIIWKLHPNQRLTALMPGPCYPLGTEPEVVPIEWFSNDSLPPMPARCDVCRRVMPDGANFAAKIDGPTFEGVTFDEFVVACSMCGTDRHASPRADRDRFLVEHGVLGDAP